MVFIDECIMKPYLFLVVIMMSLFIASASAASAEAETQWKIAQKLFADGKCPSAVIASDKAIGMDPQFGRPWNVKGCALHCLGRNKEALEAFARALELEPDLKIAQKNADHVRLDISKGAPPDTPPLVLPAVRNASIPSDGELGEVPVGEPTGCWAFPRNGHAVFFANNKTITVTGVRMAGCRYGKDGGTVRIEIWDENFTTLYSDTVPYDRIPFAVVKGEAECLFNSSWVDIGLPGHEVTGNFSVVVFTGSAPVSSKEPGLSIVYDTPSGTGTSFAMTTNPNRPDVQEVGKAGYGMEELDWMIRVLYTVPPSPTFTPGKTQAPGTQDGETHAGATPAGETQAGEPQKPAPAPLGPAVIAIALSIAAVCSVFRK
jgi:hypothetical protein